MAIFRPITFIAIIIGHVYALVCVCVCVRGVCYLLCVLYKIGNNKMF